MKLTYFTPENSGFSRSGGKPLIGFSNSGLISLTGPLVEALELKVTDKIVFVQDEDRPKDWYIVKVQDGFPLRILKESKALAAQCSVISKKIVMQFAGTGKKSIRFQVATSPEVIEGVSHWAILSSAGISR